MGESRLAQAAMWIFILPLVFCSMEMVPGWGIFDLEWPASTFYGIMTVAGIVAGFLGCEGYRVPGMIAGVVTGAGSLYATAVLLRHTTVTHSIVLVLAGFVGALPGIGLYFALRFFQDSVLPKTPPPPPTTPRV